MGRSPCCDENGLKKGPWTPEEDQKLIDYIHKHGHGSWRALPKLADLNRCGKSCRLRWTNYLRPDIKRGKFSAEEEQTILHLHSILGIYRWSAIATHLQGRTDNEIKNFWNTHLKKKLIQMGIDPVTHQPRTDLFASLPQLIALANLKDLIEQTSQFSSIQAEAAQLAKLQYLNGMLNSSASLSNNNNNSPSSILDIDQNHAMNLLNSMVSWNKEHNSKFNPALELEAEDQNQGLFPIGSIIDSTTQLLQQKQYHLNNSPIEQPSQGDPLLDHVPFNLQTSLNSEDHFIDTLVKHPIDQDQDHDDPSSWILPSLIENSPKNAMSSLPYNNPTDASSSSSYGAGDGASLYWPDFCFDESLINDVS
ncbi:hypothetical protein YC2023_076288 [Brassica napus]